MSDNEEVGGRRSRRTKKSVVNYGAEQEFSDEDLNAILGEDSDGDVPATTTKSRSRKSTGSRKSKAGGGGGGGGADTYGQDGYGVYRPANKTIYTEKGYPPDLPPIRERFPFLPEYEADGTPRIDCIVGRRAVDDKDDNNNNNNQVEEDDRDDSDHEDEDGDAEMEAEDESPRRRRGRPRKVDNNDKENDDYGAKGNKKRKSSDNKKAPAAPESNVVEYEYLVKYKNRSYLHLDWKKGADLESMGKSVKMMYRRFLNKVENGQDEELEDPDFDPLFVVPQKILAEEEQELELELTDKELLKWEKQKEKELALEEDNSSKGDDDDNNNNNNKDQNKEGSGEETGKESKDVEMTDAKAEEEEKKGESQLAILYYVSNAVAFLPLIHFGFVIVAIFTFQTPQSGLTRMLTGVN